MAHELEGLSLGVDMDASGVVDGAREAAGAVEDLSNRTSAASQKIASSAKGAGDSFEDLTDDMDSTKAASSGLSESMNTTSESSKKLAVETDKVTTSQEKLVAKAPAVDQSMKTTALSMVQVASSAMALYGAYDAIGDAELAMDRANLQVEKSTKGVDQAQKAYNDTLAKYGEDSIETQLAAESLRLKQEEVKLNTDAAAQAQENYNEKIIMAGMTAIPAVISGVDGMSKAWKGLKALDMAGSLGSINKMLEAHKLALVSAGAGLAAVAVIYGAFTTTSEDTRIALSLLAGGLVAAAAAQWVWNAATAFGLGLTGVGLALVGVAAAAAASVYLLSSQYGAKIDEDTGTTASSSRGEQASSGSGMINPQGGYVYNGQNYSVKKTKDIKARANAGEQVSSEEISFLNWLINNDREAFNSYAQGGISTEPQIATVSEGGDPEIHLTRENIESFGLKGNKTLIVYINGAKDVDLIWDELSGRLHEEGF